MSKTKDWKPKRHKTRKANEGMAEELNPNIHTGVGNPLSPYTSELLSVDDEKRIDDKGNLVTRGELWSKSATGIYLVVALHVQDAAGRSIRSVNPLLGRADIDLRAITVGHWTLSIASSIGKPRFYHPVVGACLELPSDLARDDVKRQYVVEWLCETVTECLQNRELTVPESARMNLATSVAESANLAIGASGL